MATLTQTSDTPIERSVQSTSPRRVPAAMVWICAGFLFSLLFDFDVRDGVMYWVGLLVGLALLFLTVVLPRPWLPVPLFIALLNAPDQTQSAEEMLENGRLPAASLWQLHVGPLTPAMIVFVALVLACLRLRSVRRERRNLPLLIYFLCVIPTVSLAYGYAQEAPSVFVSDAKIALFFCFGLIFATRYITAFPNRLRRAMIIFGSLAVGRYCLDAVYLFADIHKTEISGFNRVSLDSAKGLLIGLIFAAAAWALHSRRWGTVILALLSIPPAVYLLLAYQTRWLVLTFLLGVVCVAAFIGGRRLLKASVIFTAIAVVGTPVLLRMKPEVAEVLMMRFSSLLSLGAQSDPVHVDPTRAGSIVNSVSLLLHRRALMTGLGYGSWYTDDVLPMPNLYEGDFDAASLESRRFYRVHDFVFHMLLKVGVAGLVLYVGAFASPLFKLWCHRRGVLGNRQMRVCVLALIGVAPTVVTSLFWTAKGLIISGLMVAALREWARTAAPSRRT